MTCCACIGSIRKLTNGSILKQFEKDCRGILRKRGPLAEAASMREANVKNLKPKNQHRLEKKVKDMINVQTWKEEHNQFEAQINKVGSKCESRTMRQTIRCNSDSWFKETNQTKPTEKMQRFLIGKIWCQQMTNNINTFSVDVICHLLTSNLEI